MRAFVWLAALSLLLCAVQVQAQQGCSGILVLSSFSWQLNISYHPNIEWRWGDETTAFDLPCETAPLPLPSQAPCANPIPTINVSICSDDLSQCIPTAAVTTPGDWPVIVKPDSCYWSNASFDLDSFVRNYMSGSYAWPRIRVRVAMTSNYFPLDPNAPPWPLISDTITLGGVGSQFPASSSGLSNGAIAGVVVGCVAGTAILVAVAVALHTRKNRPQSKHDQFANVGGTDKQTPDTEEGAVSTAPAFTPSEATAPAPVIAASPPSLQTQTNSSNAWQAQMSSNANLTTSGESMYPLLPAAQHTVVDMPASTPHAPEGTGESRQI